jgi:RHS repeat-associated protein
VLIVSSTVVLQAQSACNPVSNNPLVMQVLCSEPPKAVPATLKMSVSKQAPNLQPISSEAINHMRLIDAPVIGKGDVLVYEANRSDFIFELMFANGKEIVVEPLTQADAENIEIRWKQGQTKLDYPETINQRIVRMRLRPLHQIDAPLLLRGVKITRNGQILLELQVTHQGPGQPFEPPMSYPSDPMVPNPHLSNVSVSRSDLLGRRPDTGLLAPRVPTFSMNPMMFQSTTTSSGDPNHYKFQGKELDAETGLYNFGARYYSPALGRYMSPDWSARPTSVPYANLANPQTLNLYSFGRNNPTSLPDIDGHDPGDKFKTKKAAAVDAVKYIRAKPDGYSVEYGTRIEKNGKVYTYQEPVTQNNPKGVDLPPLQKNDVGDVHTHENNDPLANSIQQPDKLGTIADKNAVQKMQDDPNIKVDYQSYVGAPNGDVLQFTPNSNAPDGLGDTKVVQHNVAPDPNPPSQSQQQPQPQSKPKPEQEMP